jgi:hypothetical protein
MMARAGREPCGDGQIQEGRDAANAISGDVEHVHADGDRVAVPDRRMPGGHPKPLSRACLLRDDAPSEGIYARFRPLA